MVGPVRPNTSPSTFAIGRRRLNFLYAAAPVAEGVYKMRGWDTAGSAYYYWTATDPEAAPPPSAPSLIDIAIAATLVEPTA